MLRGMLYKADLFWTTGWSEIFDGIFLTQTISVVSGEPSVLDHEHIWGHYDFESLEFKIRIMFSEGEKRMNLESVFYINSQRKELIQ